MAACYRASCWLYRAFRKLYLNPKKYSSGWNFGPYSEDVKTVEWIVKNS